MKIIRLVVLVLVCHNVNAEGYWSIEGVSDNIDCNTCVVDSSAYQSVFGYINQDRNVVMGFELGLGDYGPTGAIFGGYRLNTMTLKLGASRTDSEFIVNRTISRNDGSTFPDQSAIDVPTTTYFIEFDYRRYDDKSFYFRYGRFDENASYSQNEIVVNGAQFRNVSVPTVTNFKGDLFATGFRIYF